MTLKRVCAWAAVAASLLFIGSPASADIRDYVHSATGIAINGVPYVGRVLTAAGVPTGATCAWFSNATQVSTSCISYTVQSGDNGHTIKLQVTTAGSQAFPALTISGTPTSTGTVGSPYGFTPTSSGGAGGNVFSESGALPPGVIFTSSTGALSGTPTTAGTYAGLSISVTDSIGGSASLAANPFTITISGGGGGGSPSLDFSQAANSQYLSVVF